MTSPTVLVTGAGGPLGANVTRSLRRTGAVRLVGTDANRWHLPLSLCDATYLIPPARERDDYAAALAEVARRERVDVVLPTHPVEVRAVCELRDAGRLDGPGTALPDTVTVELADDKAASHARLERAGVPVPRSVLLGRPEDLERVWTQLGGGRGDGRPVWVRGSGAPGLGIGGRPCRAATSAWRGRGSSTTAAGATWRPASTCPAPTSPGWRCSIAASSSPPARASGWSTCCRTCRRRV